MECINCFKKGAIYKGQNKKSLRPYIVTAYYYCPYCHSDFSIDKTGGEIHTPDDPAEVLRRVLSDISHLPKDHLKLVYESVSALM